jgi:electron transfer flavoprotein beta subunit
MKFVVLVKEVPSTEARIELSGGLPDVTGAKIEINPYDEYAVEEALLQAEKNPGSTITAVMIGDDNSRKNLTSVLALGVDDAVLIKRDGIDTSSPAQTAAALAAAVKQLSPDVVLAGRQGVDYDWGLTAIAVATKLDMAHVGLISKLELSGGSFRAESEGDEGTLITEGALPALFTTDKGINNPRYPALKGIMAAKKKTVTDKTAAELVSAELPAQRQAGRMIEGATAEEKVRTLINALRNEAKVL